MEKPLQKFKEPEDFINSTKESVVTNNVVTGSLSLSTVEVHSFLAAQYWPTCHSVLESLNLLSNSGVIFDRNPSISLMWFGNKTNWLNPNWETMERWLLEHNTTNNLICLQGSRKFISMLLKQLETNQCVCSIFFCIGFHELNSKTELLWKGSTIPLCAISHESQGGATKAISKIGYLKEGLPVEVAPPLHSLRRTISHHVDVTQKGDLNYQGNDTVLEVTDLWPVSTSSRLLVRVPSIFQQGLEVVRTLTMKEFSSIWDVPLQVVEGANRRLENSFPSSLMQFLRRLLGAFFLTLLHLWMLPARKELLSSSSRSKRVKFSLDENSSRLNTEGRETPEEVKITVASKEKSASGIDMKAAKADDESPDVAVWNRRLFERLNCTKVYNDEVHGQCLEKLREGLMMKWYNILLRRSFIRYLKQEYGLGFWNFWLQKNIFSEGRKRKYLDPQSGSNLTLPGLESKREAWKQFNLDVIAARDIFHRCGLSTFWKWNSSSLIFWRWPKHYRREARDGSPCYVQGELPKYKRTQRWPKRADEVDALKEKILKVQKQRYLVPGTVKSLINFFAVPKALTDIRLVYDATKSGLNEALWAPNFWLPTVDSVLRYMSPTTWCCDIDLGDMFLNFYLDMSIRTYTGVDVTKALPEEEQTSQKGTVWKH